MRHFLFATIFSLLININIAQARYELERSFIDTMPQLPGTYSAMQSIERLNVGMMSRGTAKETPFSTQLWRDSASLCTNGAMYGLRKTLITAKEFVPFSQNIIMQASGLKGREEAYLYSFSDEGFKDKRFALHQLHHFFFLRAAQIAQESEKKQSNKAIAETIAKTIYSDLTWLSAGLTSLLSISSLSEASIYQSLTRFDYQFLTLLQNEQETIQKKVAVGATPRWQNEDHINFICDQGIKRLPNPSLEGNNLQAIYQSMRQVAEDPGKRVILSSPLSSATSESLLGVDLESLVPLADEFQTTTRDLKQVEFLATPFKCGALDSFVYPSRIFTFDLEPRYKESLFNLLKAGFTTAAPQEKGDEIHFNGFAVPDPEEMKRFLKLQADTGEISDQSAYAYYLLSKGTPADFAEARIYLKKVADQGFCYAQNRYASMLLNGEGGPIDRTKAIRYLKNVVSRGKPFEKTECACTLYQIGELEDARNGFKLAADEGYEVAKTHLANLEALSK